MRSVNAPDALSPRGGANLPYGSFLHMAFDVRGRSVAIGGPTEDGKSSKAHRRWQSIFF